MVTNTPHPPDEVLFGGVAVGVFHGQLGFADAAQAVDGLGEGGGLAGGAGRAELGQEGSSFCGIGWAQARN